MLNAMCQSPPWTNMYVAIVHHVEGKRSGARLSASNTLSPKSVTWRKYTPTFAAISH